MGQALQSLFDNPILGHLQVNALPPPVVHPPRGDLPVLLSVPHSGRDYPAWLLGQARQGLESLQALEDPFVDRLVWRALGHGPAAVIAQTPRAAVDCNRAEDEIDPAHAHLVTSSRPSPRARGGLGIVPSRTGLHGHLWRRSLTREDLDSRLNQAYRPYHRALEAQLTLLLDRFGCALLLDCHSMPPSKASDVVFGDRFGRSAAPWIVAEALAITGRAGFSAAVNDPFAGGHILDRHGSPGSGVHALQIEVDRRCYLASSGEPGGDFDRVAGLIEELAIRLGGLLLDRRAAAAAE
jgi:N-formylglutamate amidohydrolase